MKTPPQAQSSVKLLTDDEPRIRLAAMGSLDRIGWGNHVDAILDAIAYETDRVTFYTNWQVMRRQLPEAKRYDILKEERIGLRRMAALGLMEEGNRELQSKADEILGREINNNNPLRGLTISASEEYFRETTTVKFAASLAGDIRYTLDGSKPTYESQKTKEELKLNQSATLHAAVFKNQKRISAIETLTLNKISDSEWRDRLFVRKIRGEGSAKTYRAQLDGLQRGQKYIWIETTPSQRFLTFYPEPLISVQLMMIRVIHRRNFFALKLTYPPLFISPMMVVAHLPKVL